MPIDELETHPYLKYQIADFANKVKLRKYCKLIVGTFPIYAITDSEPLEEAGSDLKENWFDGAFIKYFYGSRGNHFWRLFCEIFNEEIPSNPLEAIDLLEKYNFLITDVYRQASRIKYSPSDAKLRRTVPNPLILSLMNAALNVKIVYFTSKEAKQVFCDILNIPFIDAKESNEIVAGRICKLIILISPGGNPRRAPDFFNVFPLTIEEEALRNSGDRYALSYRKRLYRHYLSLPCN